jgi:hypothetical protein
MEFLPGQYPTRTTRYDFLPLNNVGKVPRRDMPWKILILFTLQRKKMNQTLNSLRTRTSSVEPFSVILALKIISMPRNSDKRELLSARLDNQSSWVP